MNNVREENPFFLPALIATLIPAVIFAVSLACDYLPYGKYIIEPIWNLLSFLMFTAPFAAIFFSVVGLVDARKLQEPFIGCVCCLVLTLLEALFFLCWLNYQSTTRKPPEYSLVPHSHSPEENAEIESINEEINLALNGKAATETRQKKNP